MEEYASDGSQTQRGCMVNGEMNRTARFDQGNFVQIFVDPKQTGPDPAGRLEIRCSDTAGPDIVGIIKAAVGMCREVAGRIEQTFRVDVQHEGCDAFGVLAFEVIDQPVQWRRLPSG